MEDAMSSKSKKSKKGKIIGISVGVAVLLVGVVVTVILLALSGVTRTDYGNGQTIASDMADYVGETMTELTKLSENADSLSQMDVNKAKSKLMELKETLNNMMDKLGDNKAIKKDEEAKKRFDALKAVHVKYNDYLDLAVELYDTVMPIAIDMINIGTKFAEITDDNQITELIAELRDLATRSHRVNTKNDIINTSMRDMGSAMNEMAMVLEMGMNGDIDADELMDRITAASEDLTDAGQRFQDESQEIDAKAQEFADKINSLGKYLTNKANGR